MIDIVLLIKVIATFVAVTMFLKTPILLKKIDDSHFLSRTESKEQISIEESTEVISHK